MIELFHAPDNVIAISLRGEISAADIGKIKKIFEEKLASQERVGLVVDFADFADATEDAIRQDIKLEMGLMTELDRIAKVAIVTDKKWVSFFMEQAGRLLSSIDLRIFGAGQNDKAIAWAAEIPARTKSPAFHRIKTSADNVYAFAINGVISTDEMSTVIRDIDEFLDRHEKVRLLAKIGTFGFDPTILMQKGLFAMKMAAIQKVERYAIVGGPSWLQSAAKMAGPMVPGMEIKTFAEDDESKAWEWLEATAA